MIHSVKYLLCKHKDLSLDLHPGKRPGAICRQEDPWNFWLVTLTKHQWYPAPYEIATEEDSKHQPLPPIYKCTHAHIQSRAQKEI